MKRILFWLTPLVFTVALVACGGDAKRKGGPRAVDDEMCEGEECDENSTNAQNNQNNENNQSCVPSACDDRNPCTRGVASLDPNTCTTTCSFEPINTCVDGDGCCAVGCTADSDSDCSGIVCHETCPPDGNPCTMDVAETDANGCVIGCTYEPIDTCMDGDGCCPQACSDENDNDCGCVPDTCSGLGAQCGAFTNGCGASLNCGSCDPGQTCTADGRCINEQTPDCDPSVSGTCSEDSPYCIQGSCRECIGSADCASGELCEDNRCVPSPSCTADPGVCPAGFECVADQCEPKSGVSCDVNNPDSCEEGFFCDPATSTCVAAGGDLGCGLCNPDCTCDGNLVCDGFLCSGCTPFLDDCPNGQLCLPLTNEGICLPL